MAFDSSPPSNVTGLFDIYTYFDSAADGFFFMGVIIALFFIVMIKLFYRTENVGQAFAAASFISMIASILLRTVGLVGNTFMIIWILTTAGGAVWIHYENSKFN
jgi:hypothetical protein